MSNELTMIVKHFLQIFGPLAKRLFKLTSRVSSGPAKGLRFDPGPATSGFVSGIYETPVQEAVASLVHQGDVFYDIGANIGFFSVLAGRLVSRDGAVYAFEPVSKNAALVEKNASLNDFKNIKVFQIAVSDQTGKSELLLASYAGGAVLKDAGVPPDFSGSTFVETSTIDDFLKLQDIRPPDVVKIDVEGAELHVLNGMVETLRKWSPKFIIEVDDSSKTKCMEKLSACRAFLANLHYKSEIIANSYNDGNWFVRHLVARR